MPSIIAAFSTEIEADRTPAYESDYYCQFLDKDVVDRELDLFSTKWFDYRHMTPLQATGAYIEAYVKVYRDIYAREFDRARAEYITPINFERLLGGLKRGGTPKDKRQFVGCWKGRQIADMLTMPYEVYIEMAFTFRMRRWKQNTMPQPTHLYHEYDVEKIVDRWVELKAARIYTAEHSAYLVQNYQGIKHQDDYHEWLFAQADARLATAEHLAEFIKTDQLPIEKVIARVDQRTFEMVEYFLQ